jgi:hypothetical protein
MSNRALPPVFSKIAGAKIGNNSEFAKYLFVFLISRTEVYYNHKLLLPSFRRKNLCFSALLLQMREFAQSTKGKYYSTEGKYYSTEGKYYSTEASVLRIQYDIVALATGQEH